MKQTLFNLTIAVLFSIVSSQTIYSQEDKKIDKPFTQVASALKFRSLGPAHASGRIADIEVNPNNHSEYYLAVAMGNVWKTTNSGITFEPIFDTYGSYSTSDVAIDPRNTNELWVGTGEYNSQRAIGYGDGVYLSKDGGKSFKNVGLQNSEHIGRIVIDPRNSDVYVAAQGPLWGDGGERGLYKTSDKGTTWKKILDISAQTGITDIVIDPRNPDVLYCASYQRRRHVFTLINGGPESAIYKSEDAGATWQKITSGLPSGDIGRIGLAISPVNPDYVYAVIEASEKNGGFYRSTDRGESWTKQSDYTSESAQYYNRIFCDPADENKVFAVDTYTKYSTDGGKTWQTLPLELKHVDDHALWIDPSDTNHLIIGCDGGVYESFDMGTKWRHTSNLPVTQYYRVSIDNTEPFYNLCAGTQDNNSMTGPSQNVSDYGITNYEWTTTIGGDGFFSAFDPDDANIIYTEYQYGGLARFDKRSGEHIYIIPEAPEGEAYRWNWNAPMMVSSHKGTRLYFAANKLFRSENRGNSWEVISPDLTRQIDRNQLKVMGKLQSPEAVAKNASTSLFGTIVSIAESPKNENLLIVGTDDGLIQITNDGGKTWTKIEKFTSVPETTYVSCIVASQHDENTVFASFDARKNNDLKPYILKSTDKGKTWTSISSDLPKRGTVYSIAEDHINKNILFVGTEFGVFVTNDAGKSWHQLKNGLPTIAIMDIKIHKKQDDLILATFGRGLYILDDYAPLREVSDSFSERNAHIFTVKDALMFIQTDALYGQGATYFAGQNPEYGAVFTIFLNEESKSKKQLRKDAEKNAQKEGKDITYPTEDELRAEDDERAPYLILTIAEQSGKIIRRIQAPATKGVQRVTWGLRSFNQNPITAELSEPHNSQKSGMPVLPGTYTVTLSKVVAGIETTLSEAVTFNTVPLNMATLPASDKKSLAEFQTDAAKVYAASTAVGNYLHNLEVKTGAVRTALLNAPTNTSADIALADKYLQTIKQLRRKLYGDETIAKRNGNQPPSISDRLSSSVYGLWNSTSAPTQTMRDNLKLGREQLKKLISEIKTLENEINILESRAQKAGAPLTPGILPDID